MSSKRFSGWLPATVVLAALVFAPLASSVAADAPPGDWFDVTLPDQPADASDPDLVDSRRTSFDAFSAVHQLVAPADWKKAKSGGRVVVEPALKTFGARLVDCSRVQVVVEELALTAPVGGNATAKHPNVELIARVGPKNAVQASLGGVFIAEKGTGYHYVGIVDGLPKNNHTEVAHLSGDRYRLEVPAPEDGSSAPDRAVAGSDSSCSTRAVLPNTGLTTLRTLAPIGLGLVLLGTWLVWASRKPQPA